jgi:hypothetical protein
VLKDMSFTVEHHNEMKINKEEAQIMAVRDPKTTKENEGRYQEASKPFKMFTPCLYISTIIVKLLWINNNNVEKMRPTMMHQKSCHDCARCKSYIEKQKNRCHACGKYSLVLVFIPSISYRIQTILDCNIHIKI